MGKLRLETPLGLSGYAWQVKTKATMLFFMLKNMGNAPNTLEKSQTFFLRSPQKKWKNRENVPSKTSSS